MGLLLFSKLLDNGVCPIFIINLLGLVAVSVLMSAFATGCWLVVAYFFTNRFLLGWLVFYFRSCYGSALFQQQPMAIVKAPVLASAFAAHCYWLHFSSASSSANGLV
jgi:hypothetical protein